jgi:hypothetical protein
VSPSVHPAGKADLLGRAHFNRRQGGVKEGTRLSTQVLLRLLGKQIQKQKDLVLIGLNGKPIPKKTSSCLRDICVLFFSFPVVSVVPVLKLPGFDDRMPHARKL